MTPGRSSRRLVEVDAVDVPSPDADFDVSRALSAQLPARSL